MLRRVYNAVYGESSPIINLTLRYDQKIWSFHGAYLTKER